jgi:hypothetical protein
MASSPPDFYGLIGKGQQVGHEMNHVKIVSFTLPQSLPQLGVTAMAIGYCFGPQLVEDAIAVV